MFFQLMNHCRLVEGAYRAAIYNLDSGKVLSVNGGAADLISACREQPVEDVLAELPNPEPFQAFLNTLSELELGQFVSQHRTDRQNPDPASPAPHLEFLWLELTSRCNNRCLHCYSGSDMSAEETAVPHERWLSLLAEARAAGADSVQLIGGEPLLYPDWRELVTEADRLGFTYIEIFTNATRITDDDIVFFQAHHVRVATTIYADNAQIHDTVTQNAGSFGRTLTAVKSLLTAGVPLRIASIIMKANENEAENIMRLCSSLGVESGPPDVIRPTGRGDDAALLPSTYRRLPVRPPFFTEPESFFRAQQSNDCLAGKIAVTAAGDVIPCIFARSMVCGNILQSSLQEIISAKPLQQCWHTTRDCIEKCGDCEYRYACHDCRALAQGTDPGKIWLAASPGCSYNPYTGKWEDTNEHEQKTP